LEWNLLSQQVDDEANVEILVGEYWTWIYQYACYLCGSLLSATGWDGNQEWKIQKRIPSPDDYLP